MKVRNPVPLFSASVPVLQRPFWARYGVAALCTILGWVSREALTSVVGPTALPFIFFFPAIALSGWFGGLGPALFSMVIAAVAAQWFFIEPLHSFESGGPADSA